MFEIEQNYNVLENDLTRLFEFATNEKQSICLVDELELAKTYEVIKDALQLAKLYEIDRLKRSQGGRKSSANMTAEQRRERARKAGRSKRARHKPNRNRTLSI